MITEWVKTVKKQGLEELSECRGFITGTREGAAITFRNYKIIDIATFLSDVFETIAKVRGLWQSKVDGFGKFNNEKYISDWWGPKKDVIERLDRAQLEAQKQIGYF